MTGHKHVVEVSQGPVDLQELPVVDAIFLLRRAELIGKEGEELRALRSLLGDSTDGSSWRIRDRVEPSNPGVPEEQLETVLLYTRLNL